MGSAANIQLINEIEEYERECPGCETGSENGHKLKNGQYHPECCTELAEKEKIKKRHEYFLRIYHSPFIHELGEYDTYLYHRWLDEYILVNK
jgi:hypothetical protein